MNSTSTLLGHFLDLILMRFQFMFFVFATLEAGLHRTKRDMISWNRQRNMLRAVSKVKIADAYGNRTKIDILDQIRTFVRRQKATKL